MGLLIEFEGSKSRPHCAGVSNLILTQPLNNVHVEKLTQAFENYHSTGLWHGFTIFEKIPMSLTETVMATRIKAPLGAALFCKTNDPILFLFRDLQENFHLLTSDGDTLKLENKIESLLSHFHNIDTV